MGKYDILWNYFLSKTQEVPTTKEKIDTCD